MEQGEFDALPSPFYARSYLRTYAHFLGLDASAVLREYREQTSEQDSFERPFSRGWDRGPRRSPNREEGGYRQWPLPEKEDREASSWTGKGGGRDWEREPSAYEPERSDDFSYPSQEWGDFSR